MPWNPDYEFERWMAADEAFALSLQRVYQDADERERVENLMRLGFVAGARRALEGDTPPDEESPFEEYEHGPSQYDEDVAADDRRRANDLAAEMRRLGRD